MNCANEIEIAKPVFDRIGFLENNSYKTDVKTSFLKRFFRWNTLYYYCNFIRIVLRGASMAKRNKYTRQFWLNLSSDCINLVENCGGIVNIEGLENLKKTDGPVIFVANHMSTLETIALPCMILREKELAITLKKQLLDIPIFGTLLSGFKTVVVSRISPIDDYKVIMKDGVKAIKAGYSILIFPQSSRTTQFSPKDFNSIGVKLAKRAKVPIIPIALKTDFWKAGKFVKDFGKIDRKNKVFFKFGNPIIVEGNGKKENKEIVGFIEQNLNQWQNIRACSISKEI